MKHVPIGELTVYTTTSNVHTVINAPVNSATSVNTQSHINNRLPPGYPPPIVNSTNSYLPNVNTILSPNVHNVDNSNIDPSITPTYLYDLLTPHLLHQHSLRTAVHDLLLPLPPMSTTPISTLTALHRLLSEAPRLHSILPPLPRPPPGTPLRTRPMRAPPVSYADPTEPPTFPMPCPISFPFGDLEGVAAAPSTLSTPDSDAGLGLFGIRPKKSSYAKLKHPRHLFARKGDYICSYHGLIRSVAECVSQPSMYLFSDPTDPLHRYIDSWDPNSGVTSYGGLVNESFQDEQINCTIKWPPGHPTAGIYAKRDIILHEELLTGYGKPQWIYAIYFFSHLLSPRTIQEATVRYRITNKDTLAPQFAAHITSPPTHSHIPRSQRQDSRLPLAEPAPPTSTLDLTTMPIHHQDLRIPTTPSERNLKNPPSPTAPTSCHYVASPTDAQDSNMTPLAPTAPTPNNSPTSLTIPLLAPALSTNNHQQAILHSDVSPEPLRKGWLALISGKRTRLH